VPYRVWRFWYFFVSRTKSVASIPSDITDSTRLCVCGKSQLTIAMLKYQGLFHSFRPRRIDPTCELTVEITFLNVYICRPIVFIDFHLTPFTRLNHTTSYRNYFTNLVRYRGWSRLGSVVKLKRPTYLLPPSLPQYKWGCPELYPTIQHVTYRKRLRCVLSSRHETVITS